MTPSAIQGQDGEKKTTDRHVYCRLRKGTNVIQKVIALAGGAAVVAGLALAGTGAAMASPRANPDGVSPVQLFDEQGTAGWYTQSFGVDYRQADATFTLTNVGAKLPADATGSQECNSEDQSAIQVGAVATAPATINLPALYTIGIGYGPLPSTVTGPTGDGDNCDGNKFLPQATFTGLINDVPAGHKMQVELQVVPHEFGGHSGPAGVWFRAEDITLGVADFNQFRTFSQMRGVLGPFNEVGDGVSADTDTLSAPAVNDLTDFSNVSACAVGGSCHGLAYWNAVSVSSSADGQAPPLMTPTMISPTLAACVWHPGHREYFGPKGHRTGYIWLKGYRTCTGEGSSVFSIDGGSIVGP